VGIGKGGKYGGSTRAVSLGTQTSLRGSAVPLLYGRYRVTPKLIWNGNFQASPVSSGKKGGKFGTQYDYTIAGDWLICHYPLQNLLSGWSDKDYHGVTCLDTVAMIASNQVDLTSVIAALGSGSNAWSLVAILGCHLWGPYSATFNDFGGDGPVTVSSSWDVPLWNEHYYTPDGQAGSTRRPLTYEWNPADGNVVHFPDSTLNGGAVTIRFAVVQRDGPVWTQGPLSQKNLNMELERYLAQGSEYVTDDSEQVHYNWVSGVGSVKFDLGSANILPAFSFEAMGACDIWRLGGCDPADIILDLIAGVTLCSDANPWSSAPEITLGQNVSVPHNVNSAVGASLPITLGNLSPMRAWCRANGISCSLYLDSQKTAKEVLDELFTVANCAPVWSGSLLNAIPYDEVSAADHGLIYTAPTAAGPICGLDDNCFLVDGNTPPVTMDRTRQADAHNVIKITHADDGSDTVQWAECAYNDTVTTEIEQRSVAQFGARPADAKDMHSITKPSIAQKIASVLVKRSALQRNSYKFNLPVTYCFLEAMDLVAITDSCLGLNQHPVRLTSVEESWDEQKGWTLACEAEDFIYGLNHPTPMEVQASNPFTNPSNVDPGSVNTPVFMELPDSVNGGPGHWLHIALSGASPNWGGCVVWLSTDGVTYTQVGVFTGKSTMGVINENPAPAGAPGNWNTGPWPVTSDPDTLAGFWVDLTMSDGSLESATAATANAFQTLCWVDGELIAYDEVDLVTGNAYAFSITPGSSGLIRRGLFGTPITAHNANAPFVRLDENIFALRLDPKWVNSSTVFPQTLFFKFTSFNTVGGGAQSLDQATEFQHNFSGGYNNILQIVGNNATLDWDPASVTSSGCTLRAYGPSGVTSNITYYRSDGTTLTNVYMAFLGVPLNTVCWIMYSPAPNANWYTTSYQQMITACGNGAVCLGSVTTPVYTAGAVSGGSKGGGGGAGGGGGTGPGVHNSN
jgi:hypothetical protein